MKVTHAAHDLSEAALGGPIGLRDGSFVDPHGRTLALHGVNVSGASKLPTTPNGLSHLTEGFYESHRIVTFEGRPFTLDEAPLHFRRLRAWGLPLIRLLVTWESIGHAGPDPNADLDLDYIGYLRRLIEMMPEYGLKCFVCAHQDVWSRFSGGSGAPAWTFEVAGLDIEAFTATGAAYVHGQDEKRRAEAPVNEREPSGPFVWPSGYQKIAASTMATLFWAGEALAPDLKCQRSWYGAYVEGSDRLGGDGDVRNDAAAPPRDTGGDESVSVQAFLQDSFIEAFGRLADEVVALEACIGFEPLNEPHRGLVNLHGFHSWNYDTDLHIGHYPSLAQALALASGYAQKVDYYVKSWPFPTRVSHKSRIDPEGRSAWLSATSPTTGPEHSNRGLGKCVWRSHGVWKWDETKAKPTVLQDDYFELDHRPGREGMALEWYRDCYAPFLKRFSDRMTRKARATEHSSSFSFIEPIPNEFMPPWPETGVETDNKDHGSQKYAAKTLLETPRPSGLVFAPHFYDLNVLFGKYHSWMSVNVQGLARGMFILNALYFGARALRRNYRKQIRNILEYGRTSLGAHVPAVIGEVGIPFDVNGREAFATGRYDKQRELMHALISAMEDNAVGFTLWNYNPHNRAEYGDGWNKEDFSIMNGDGDGDGNGDVDEVEGVGAKPDYANAEHEHDELYRGGRVLGVIIRPYAVKIAGRPVKSDWDPESLRFEFEWTSGELGGEGDLARTTEVFVPEYHYSKHGIRAQVSDGEWSFDAERQTLLVRHDPGSRRHRLVVEIPDAQQHLLDTVERRRRAFPPMFPFSLLSPGVEVAWDRMDSTWLLVVTLIPVLVLVGAVVAQRM